MDDALERSRTFLQEWGIGLEDLVAHVRPLSPSETLLLVGSIPEGLANPLSDIDLILIGDGALERGVVLAETELQHATSLFKEREVHVQLLQTQDAEQLADKVHAPLSRMDNGSEWQSAEQPTTTQICLLDRVRTGIPLVNPQSAEHWRKRMGLHRLPEYLARYWLQEFRSLRDDVILESNRGDTASTQCVVRLAFSALTAALLASVGVTNTYPKWRPKLLRQNEQTIGKELCSKMLDYLFLPAKGNGSIAEAIAFADGISARIASGFLPAFAIPETRLTESVEAWVLHAGKRGREEAGRLERVTIDLPPMGEDDVLAEPLYGCWEGNMAAALDRSPVDVCRLRHEEMVVLGNAGVVRVLQAGSSVRDCREGDIALIVPIAAADRYGYTVRVLGYDAPKQAGLLAKRVVLHSSQVLSFKTSSRFKLPQWAGFPIRYTTAWENWLITFRVWQAQFDAPPTAYVWGWGGGVAFAELQLARAAGCQVVMIASKPERLAVLAEYGISPVDRREFEALDFDETRYESDRGYRAQYLKAEGRFLEKVRSLTEGEGVSIFIDNIGAPVFRATLRALGRLGIVTTAGWKHGKHLSYDRAVACVQRNTFLHTHGCRRAAGVDAVEYGERSGWLPPPPDRIWGWDEIPELADAFKSDKIPSYFPVFAINPP